MQASRATTNEPAGILPQLRLANTTNTSDLKKNGDFGSQDIATLRCVPMTQSSLMVTRTATVTNIPTKQTRAGKNIRITVDHTVNPSSLNVGYVYSCSEAVSNSVERAAAHRDCHSQDAA